MAIWSPETQLRLVPLRTVLPWMSVQDSMVAVNWLSPASSLLQEVNINSVDNVTKDIKVINVFFIFFFLLRLMIS